MQITKIVIGLFFSVFVIAAAFAWLFNLSEFTWPMFLVWILMAVLAIGFIGPARPPQ